MSGRLEPGGPLAEQGRGPERRPPAWVCVMINQLAFPGMGTVMAGRRVGYAQALLMVVGFLLVMGYFGRYFLAVYRYWRDTAMDQAGFEAMYLPYRWVLWDGLGLCLVAWLWALKSSLGIWCSRPGMGPTGAGAGSRDGH